MFDEYAWEERDQGKVEEGKEIGMNEKAEQTARNLLSSGKLPLGDIAEATGLTSERVRELSEKKP